MKFKSLLYLFFLMALPVLAFSQNRTLVIKLNWNPIEKIKISENEFQERLNFDNASYHENYPLTPYFEKKILFDGGMSSIRAELHNAVYQSLTGSELMAMENLLQIPEQIVVETNTAFARRAQYVSVSFLPFRLNAETAKYEKLVSCNLVIIADEKTEKSGQETQEWADHSVLSTGDWFKIRVNADGIFQVSYDDLKDLGVNVSSLHSENIRLYGNGGGMLPEPNSEFRYDDLQENAIEIVDGGDGTFDAGDYFLFYGQSPDRWVLRPDISRFYHHRNVYSDYTYYFITVDMGPGKRIPLYTPEAQTPNYTVTRFTDYAFYENDQYNLIKSGRQWFGELFDFTNKNYSFGFYFPNLDPEAEHYLRVRTAAKAEAASSFFGSVDGENVVTMLIPGVSSGPNGDYAKAKTGEKVFNTNNQNITVDIQYNNSTSAAKGWLDYIEVNAVCMMTFQGGQMLFRDPHSIGENRISEFILGNTNGNVKIWETTDPLNVRQIKTTTSGNTEKFVLPTPVLREFVAFISGPNQYHPEMIGKVPNQDLHAARNIDYVIVTHPDFMDQANELANFHRSFSGLNVLVTTPENIYNEFSSGAQDITAIKDLMRMLYETADNGHEPRYLLLFGDASYDYKDIQPENTNFVPTFESEESLHHIGSYATDDFFGFLDPTEGTGSNELLDIGIGRFIVRTSDEAQMAVDKVKHYATSPLSMGDWRNMVTFVADDENGNTHINQAEQLATFVDTAYPVYNIDKIYLDSYQQISTPGGQRYPEVNEAINTRIEKGTLIMNYTGHGGEVGWAHERILELSDINSWTNYNKLAVFVTATCEFTRYDDPGRISAGEYVFLNKKGGAISLFTTARATFGGSNLSLNKGFYKHVFEKVNGEYNTMGDLIRLAKLESSSETNDKKFVLIGDPALKIAYPDYNIQTTTINQDIVSENADTLKALSYVTISGRIVDESDNPVTDYQGTLYSIVYDKESEVTTLGQDDGSTPRTFKLRKNVIYKGKARVIDGEFTFSFVVPKDIAYQYGPGRLSYYIENGEKDASGYFNDIIVGGYSKTGVEDNTGPEIQLYMNDSLFKPGDITNENPQLYAVVFDDNGINTVGNSIGHDIVAILDDDNENPFILNDFYEADINSFQQGSVRYPFFNIPAGQHTVKFKIWDVYNNPSEALLNFVVVDAGSIVISDLINYPNPFSGTTNFRFNHNQSDAEMDVEIEIFDLTGRKIATLKDHINNDSFYSAPIQWDGTNDNGRKLIGGIYIYRTKITNEDGVQTSAANKLLIAR
jgi:hypothetical protein